MANSFFVSSRFESDSDVTRDQECQEKKKKDLKDVEKAKPEEIKQEPEKDEDKKDPEEEKDGGIGKDFDMKFDFEIL